MKVRILGISGTPIKDGNCDKLVQEALKAAAEIEGVETDFITLADKDVAMCDHCQYCIQNRTRCKIDDDIHEIYDRIRLADGLILGGPTWAFTLAPPLINMFSRGRYIVFFTHEFRNKAAGCITCGWFGKGMDNALDVIEDMVSAYTMVPVARGSAIVSTAAYGERPAYLERGGLDDKKGVVSVRNVGWRVAEVARMIRFATDSGAVVPPEYRVIASGGTSAPQKKKFISGVWRDAGPG